MSLQVKEIRHSSSFSIENLDEIDQYICELYDIKEHYLVGRVKSNKNSQSTAKIFFIEDLVNPFTGQNIGQLIGGGRKKPNAICRQTRLEDVNLQENQLVLFQFKIENLSDSNLSKGNILAADKNSVIPIDDNYDLLRELQITVADLKVPGILNTDNPNEIAFWFFNDFYKDAIKEKVKQEVGKIRQEIVKLDNRKQFWRDEETRIRDLEGKVQNELNVLNRKRHELDQDRENLIKLNEKLKQIGLSVLEEREEILEECTKQSLEIPDNEEELVKGIQRQIAAAGLHYELQTILRLYTTLKTNQFIILSGPSGTGKTSLIAAFAECISAQYKIIPVQPSWMDRQDLLGFYNPMRKQYVPSVFIDTLIAAKKQPEKLFIICLDELNLAQIEYYLADLLSVRELKKPTLELYSRYEYDQAMEEVNWYIQKVINDIDETMDRWIEDHLGINTMEQFAFMQRYQNLKRYPFSFELPENVRLIGTMNVDGTVRPLSPKVIDRSFILELLKQDSKVDIPEELGCYPLPAQHFMVELDNGNPDADLTKRFTEFNKRLISFHANYNNRVENHLGLYGAAAQPFNLTNGQLDDELFVMKLLPRIHYLMEEDSSTANFVNWIRDEFGEKSLSYKKVSQMHSASHKSGVFTYWS
ncbi:McrB family protein [Neobacillus drentensis]|uniref:McrB family protein n=1 Tax=Neobacillus drentensis TaxID=220684 RepID=UPI0030017287